VKLGRTGLTLSYRRQLALFLAPLPAGHSSPGRPAALATWCVLYRLSRHWVAHLGGLDNFRRLLETPLVRVGLNNTLTFAGLAVPLRLLGALVLALLLGGGTPAGRGPACTGRRSTCRRSYPKRPMPWCGYGS